MRKYKDASSAAPGWKCKEGMAVVEKLPVMGIPLAFPL